MYELIMCMFFFKGFAVFIKKCTWVGNIKGAPVHIRENDFNVDVNNSLLLNTSSNLLSDDFTCNFI